MFAGIVEEVGKIISINRGAKSSVLNIEGKSIFDDLKIGDSVAVNGVCLTVTSIRNYMFTADVMSETLSRSSFSDLKLGSGVNLERAMLANARFGGHIVSGHIDGIGTISSIKREDNAIWYTIETSQKVVKYIVQKGSIAIDGISLTVANVKNSSFSVSIIPHTIKSTILLTRGIGDIVNLENDIVGKYIERFLEDKETSIFQKKTENKITKEFLMTAGF